MRSHQFLTARWPVAHSGHLASSHVDAGMARRVSVLAGRGLGLAHRLALLAIDPENGRLRGTIGYGIAAAALLDLAARGRIAVRGDRVHPIDERPTGDAGLDLVLCRIIDDGRVRSAADTIRALGRTRDLRERVIRELERDSLIRRLDDRVPPIFPRERYLPSQRPRAYHTARLRATLLGPPAEATPDDAALGIVIGALGMLDRFVGRDERELAGLRVAMLTRESREGSAVASALSEIRVLATTASLAAGGPASPADRYPPAR